MIEIPTQARKWDRLAAFFNVYPLSVRLMPASSAVRLPAMFLFGDRGEVDEVALTVRANTSSRLYQLPLAVVEVNFGGVGNPLLNAMSDTFHLNTGDHPALRATSMAFLLEMQADRCGSSQALNRLGEVLVLFVLRAAIEAKAEVPGLLAGLAHPNLYKVLVAVHEAPSRLWDVDSLADIAGMSRSRFMSLFSTVLGVSPIAYLNRWRLEFGRRELLREGVKVKTAAQRSGFGSSEAFSRAFKKEFGFSPTEIHSEPKT